MRLRTRGQLGLVGVLRGLGPVALAPDAVPAADARQVIKRVLPITGSIRHGE
ncbi:MAG: hypothetical protein V4579_03720 [Pseudomonadota bacterium]